MSSSPFECQDCEQVRATAESGYTVAAVRSGAAHKRGKRRGSR